MNLVAMTSDTPALLAHLPKYGLLLVLIPLLFVVLMKLFLALRTGSARRAPAQWIVSGEYDEDGLPTLARARSASDAARFHAAMATYKPRNGR